MNSMIEKRIEKKKKEKEKTPDTAAAALPTVGIRVLIEPAPLETMGPKPGK